MQEKYGKDLDMSKPNKKEHQQEPQELSKEKPQREPAEADFAAGGGAKAGVHEKAWLPAEPNKMGFAGQGLCAQ